MIIAYFLSYLNISNYSILSIHDQFIYLGNINNIFNIFNYDDFGSQNAVSMLVNLFDRIYIYVFGNNLEYQRKIDLIGYGLKFLILIFIPLIATKKLIDSKTININIYCLSLFYSLNPFTLLYFDGNGFSFNLIIAYALMPLAFYYFNILMVQKTLKFKDVLHFILISTIINFSLYLALVFYLFLLAYLAIDKKFNIINLKNLMIIFIYAIPFNFTFIFLTYIYISDLSILRVSSIGGDAAGNIALGLEAPFLLYPAWTIYSKWPRTIMHWDAYFESIYYISGILLFYLSAVVNKYKNNEKNLKKYSLLFFIFIVIYTGPQPGFGFVYEWMQNIPLFRIIRSPDYKISMLLIFIIYLYIINTVRNNMDRVLFLFFPLLVVSITPFFYFNFIMGEKYENNYSRNYVVKDDLMGLIRHLDLMSLRGVDKSYIKYDNESFGKFKNEGQYYIGQDIVSNLIDLPKVSSTIHSNVPQELKNGDDGVYKYYLKRSDIDEIPINFSPHSFNVLYSNSTYTLFEKKNFNSPCKFSYERDIFALERGCEHFFVNISKLNKIWYTHVSDENKFNLFDASLKSSKENFSSNTEILEVNDSFLNHYKEKYIYMYYFPTLIFPYVIFLNLLMILLTTFLMRRRMNERLPG